VDGKGVYFCVLWAVFRGKEGRGSWAATEGRGGFRAKSKMFDGPCPTKSGARKTVVTCHACVCVVRAWRKLVLNRKRGRTRWGQ